MQVTDMLSGNHGGKRRETKYLIVHYTASENAAGSIAWLRTPASKASAHRVIAQDGSHYRLVPDELVAWHAGVSRWGTDQQLNLLSIGIELVYPGPLTRVGKGRYASMGRTYTEAQVMCAEDKVWPLYPEPQLAELERAVAHFKALYPGILLLGHSEVARKQDPGPVFPWARFRDACPGVSP